MAGDPEQAAPDTPDSDHHCPYWRKGYCVADRSCKLAHDPSQGGQLQESYLAQTRSSRPMAIPQMPHPQMPHVAAHPQAAAYHAHALHAGYPYANPSQLASALYGGQTGHMQPVAYGYGYYPSLMPIGAPMPPPPPAPMNGPPRNYKTVQCRHFQRGHCLRGNACGFRHGEEQPAEGQSEVFGQLPAELSNPIHPGRLFRVRTCKRWIQGSCSLGDRCTFRHDYESADNAVQQYSGHKRTLSPDRETTATPPSRDEPVIETPPNEEMKSPVDRDGTKVQKI